MSDNYRTRTANEMKKELLERIMSDLDYRQSGLKERFKETPKRQKERAQQYLDKAIRKAVASGEKLPGIPCKDPVAIAPDCSYFTNAGGLVMPGEGGIPVSVAASKATPGDFVSVLYNGAPCVMTVEEAFERSLPEYVAFECKASEAEAVKHVVGRIQEGAGELLHASQVPLVVTDLVRARRILGYTQAQLANELGWSTKQVSNIETGARPLQRQTALAVEGLLHRMDLLNAYVQAGE